MESIFDRSSLADIVAEIQETYRQYPNPWVIGYSGGKDSTAVLQLVWLAVSRLDPEQRTRPVYVIASDTRVETPVIVDYITETIAAINKAAEEQGLPFEAQTVEPSVDESFWVNLLGRGYPAPTVKFRWCTERMKINPANRFVREKVKQNGEVIMVLGTRKAESQSRAQLMNTYSVEGHATLRYHKYLEGAYVYAPIADFTTDDVWSFLMAHDETPWGTSNAELKALYRNANKDGECPLVIDGSTPSCGNSRFGCWVCTVVESDISMKHMVQNGEHWLKPLFDFRNHLAATRNDNEYRSVRGRHGNIRKRNGRALRGSYNFKAGEEYLRMLLEAQRSAREGAREAGREAEAGLELVTKEELFAIRRLWRTEGLGAVIDAEDRVPRIYREVFGAEADLDWPQDDDGFLDPEQEAALAEACEAHDVHLQLLKRLLEAERRTHGMARRASIHRDIATEIRKEWAVGSDEAALQLEYGDTGLVPAEDDDGGPANALPVSS